LITDVDGTSAVVNVTIDNSATLSTATSSDSTTTYTSGQGGVLVEIDQDGDGTTGHSVTLDITGGGSNYYIKQSGVNDNTVDATFSGDGHDVDITQSD
jgi:hypothetical protein